MGREVRQNLGFRECLWIYRHRVDLGIKVSIQTIASIGFALKG